MNKFVYHNSIVYYHPELGWLISWLIIDGQEILYCDKTSLNSSSVRWWIPTMLPNPGVGDWILPRHGIARTAQFAAKEYWNSLTLALDRKKSIITPEQYSLFAHDFIYDLSYELIDHGCIITQQIINPSSDQDLPIWFWLHPYFPTPNSITQIQHWIESDLVIDHHNDDTQVLKNTWTIKLNYSSYNLIIKYSDIYERVWIWTPPWHGAVCIEPVTHDVGDYFINPIIIAPWEQITGTMKFMIETVN